MNGDVCTGGDPVRCDICHDMAVGATDDEHDVWNRCNHPYVRVVNEQMELVSSVAHQSNEVRVRVVYFQLHLRHLKTPAHHV